MLTTQLSSMHCLKFVPERGLEMVPPNTYQTSVSDSLIVRSIWSAGIDASFGDHGALRTCAGTQKISVF